MTTAFAVFEVSASSGRRWGGQPTTRNEIDERNASISRRDSVEESRSCTTNGRSLTVRAIALLSSNKMIRGSTKASASARRSRVICVSSFRACARIRRISVLCGDLAFLARLLNHDDEHVLQGEVLFVDIEHADARTLELLGRRALLGLHVLFRDDMQTISKQRHAPAFRLAH